jgi:hypothetical protein
MQKEQELKDSQIRKHYNMGDHVKVLSGQHEGATGLIVKVDDSSNTVVLFSDTTQQEVRPEVNLVLSAILQLEEKPTAKLLLGQREGKTGLTLKVDDSSTMVVPFFRHYAVKGEAGFVERSQRVLDVGCPDTNVGRPMQCLVWPLSDPCPDPDVFLVQIRVFSHDIVEAAEVSSGLTKFGEYELHDLVALE